MSSANQFDRGGTALLGLLLALGLIIGGWLLGAQIKATRLSDRYVTVKGLVERNVKSDLAIWPLSYKEAGDDLSLLYAKAEADKKTILQFLDQQGMQSSEIELAWFVKLTSRPMNMGTATGRLIATSSNSRSPYGLHESVRSPMLRRKRCNYCKKALS
jgi:hypothetical protein